MVIGRKLKILIWIAIGVTVVALALPIVGSKDSLVPLLVGLFGVTVAVTIPVVLGRKRMSFMSAWLAVYVIAYSVLSWNGGYIDANLGGNDNRSI
jgi:purine-cytosine permease-like protein